MFKPLVSLLLLLSITLACGFSVGEVEPSPADDGGLPEGAPSSPPPGGTETVAYSHTYTATGTVDASFSRTLAKLRDQDLLTVKGKTVTLLCPIKLLQLKIHY